MITVLVLDAPLVILFLSDKFLSGRGNFSIILDALLVVLFFSDKFLSGGGHIYVLCHSVSEEGSTV